jgi:hypothetical protein
MFASASDAVYGSVRAIQAHPALTQAGIESHMLLWKMFLLCFDAAALDWRHADLFRSEAFWRQA